MQEKPEHEGGGFLLHYRFPDIDVPHLLSQLQVGLGATAAIASPLTIFAASSTASIEMSGEVSMRDTFICDYVHTRPVVMAVYYADDLAAALQGERRGIPSC